MVSRYPILTTIPIAGDTSERLLLLRRERGGGRGGFGASYARNTDRFTDWKSDERPMVRLISPHSSSSQHHSSSVFFLAPRCFFSHLRCRFTSSLPFQSISPTLSRQRYHSSQAQEAKNSAKMVQLLGFDPADNFYEAMASLEIARNPSELAHAGL